MDQLTASDRAKRSYGTACDLLEDAKTALNILSRGHTRPLTGVEVRWRYEEGATGAIAWGDVEASDVAESK